MFRKLLLTLVLLPFISIAVADEDGPNPGDDNPGSTTTTLNFYMVGFGDGNAFCFDSTEFCADVFANPVMPPKTKGKKLDATAIASAYAYVACEAAASAASGYAYLYEAGGELNLTRHGNHGAMHHIRFDAGLAAASVTVAEASAEASAAAEAGAYTFAEVESLAEVCTDILLVDLFDIGDLCLAYEVFASAESEAIADASSFASSGASSGSQSFGAVAAYNEVWAANIEQYQAAVWGASGSYSFANAEAAAEAFAHAYATSFAEALFEACASAEIPSLLIEAEICDDDAASASAFAEAYAAAFANAQAAAFAEVEVAALMPATYINENGILDTISFGPEAEGGASTGLAVECSTNDVPEPE